MEPTLHSTDVIFTETVSSRLHRYNYGDIIVFKSAQNHEELVCKRIVGLPGDKINFRDKHRVSIYTLLFFFSNNSFLKSQLYNAADTCWTCMAGGR